MIPPTTQSSGDAVLEALLGSPLAVGVIDRELRYTQVNAALARLYDRDPQDFIGYTVHDATPRQADQLEPALRRVFDDGTSIHDLEMHGDEPTAERIWTKHLLPLRDASGSITRVIVTAQEFTAQRHSPDPTFEPSERAAFLLRLSDALRLLTDPLEVQRVVRAAKSTRCRPRVLRRGRSRRGVRHHYL